jgi:hypothetical protein
MTVESDEHDGADRSALLVRYQSIDAETERELDLSRWPGTVELRTAFAEALRHVTGPIGTWQRAITVRTSVAAVKALVGWLAERQVASVAELSPAVWNDWRLHLIEPSAHSGAGRRATVMSGRERLLDSRVATLALPGLRDDTARAVEMRIGRVQRVKEKPFYTKDQFDAIHKAAMRAVWAAHHRIISNWQLLNLADADAARLPEPEQIKRAALTSLMRHGQPQSQDEERVWVSTARSLAPTRVLKAAFAQLWLTRSEGLAAGTWLAALTGEDWSAIHRKQVPTTAASLGDGELILFTRDSKPRRGPTHHDQPSQWHADHDHIDGADDGGRGRLADSDRGQAGRALRLITEACAPAREFRRARGLDCSTLIYTRSYHRAARSWNAPEPGLPGFDASDRPRMVEGWWPWPREQGPTLNFTALRNTHQAGSWRGSQVPAGHTAETHLHYRLANPSQVEAGRDAALAGSHTAHRDTLAGAGGPPTIIGDGEGHRVSAG